MSTIEALYLTGSLCAFFAFAVTLAWADWYTHRPAKESRAPAGDMAPKRAGG